MNEQRTSMLPQTGSLLDDAGPGEDAWHLGYWQWVVRRFSPPLVAGLKGLGLHPNQMTIVAMLIGLAGAVLLGSGRYEAGIAGALLLNLYFLLDDVDGTLARAAGKTSVYGAYLDAFASHLVNPLLFVAAGVHVYRAPHLPLWPSGVEGARLFYLTLGWIGALTRVQRRLLRLLIRVGLQEVGDDGSAAAGVGLTKGEGRRLGPGHLLRRHLVSSSGSIFPGILLAAVLRRLDVFLLIMVAGMILDLAVWVVQAPRGLRRAERRRRKGQ